MDEPLNIWVHFFGTLLIMAAIWRWRGTRWGYILTIWCVTDLNNDIPWFWLELLSIIPILMCLVAVDAVTGKKFANFTWRRPAPPPSEEPTPI